MNLASKNATTQQSIDEWAALLCSQEMPIFSNTAHRVYASLDDKHKGAIDLAEVILQDPNLTSKLLKVGNSSYYNPSRQKMSTVSRAIVILGAEAIRELTIACSFFESILSSSNKQRANQEIAKAIHAAVQAKELAIVLRDSSPEEVFIATLLHNIGSVAFWCSDQKQTTQIHDLLSKTELTPEEAEKKVLGFTLQELGKRLGKAWHLGGLIEDALSPSERPDNRVQCVQMGIEIDAALKAGWDSAAMNDCLSKLKTLSGEHIESLKARIEKNTLIAVKIARQFGAHDASQFISTETVSEDEAGNGKTDPKQIQFQILQDISAHLSGKIDLNILIDMVLEGIHRGVGMDRTLFMLMSQDKRSLKEKVSVGWLKPLGAGKIQLFSEASGNLPFDALMYDQGLWALPDKQRSLFTQQILDKIGLHECLLFPLHTDQKIIGLIYCDRSTSHLPLTRQDFNDAKHFAAQANIGLTLYSIRH